MKFYITIALASIAALASAEEIEEGGDPLSSGIEEFADGLNQTFIVIEEETNDLQAQIDAMKADQARVQALVDEQRAMIDQLTLTDEQHRALIEELTGENRTLIDQLTEENRFLSEENRTRIEEQLSQDQQIDNLNTDVLTLNDEQVVEDHFFSNREFIRILDNNKDLCTEPFIVPAGMTLDFNARVNLTHLQVKDNRKVMGRIFLVKNETDRVAQHWIGTNMAWSFPGAAMTYREKLDDQASYQYCFTWNGNHDDGMAPRFNHGMFQWGYKILGQEYQMVNHDFKEDDLIVQEGDPAVWHY